jgi:hypothetical protein
VSGERRRFLPLLVVVLGGIATALVAGGRRGPAPRPIASSSRALDDVGPVTSARRPARRYYMTRSQEGCEVYFVDPTHVSEATHTPCPASVVAGERIRIAGKTCVRESDDTTRIEPVVCPDPLTNLEKRERGELLHDAGP